jgi:hypothetical protein
MAMSKKKGKKGSKPGNGGYKHQESFPRYNVVFQDGERQRPGKMDVRQIPGKDNYILSVYFNNGKLHEQKEISSPNSYQLKEAIKACMTSGLVEYNQVLMMYAR